ncbi:MAG: aminotransferase class I/II-fold pyridoxal phosphate-dependent enzyme [FCB group bacterium]|nr:aminotransferase class I/II-fold pyridoxal phosphate-dependent enzyme [FCB group bacterium]
MSQHVNEKWGFASLAVHGSGGTDPATGAVSPPLCLSSTFAFKNSQHGADLFSGAAEGYIYSRISNPTLDALHQEMAFLEAGEMGLSFGSGMSAIFNICISLCSSGDNFVTSNTIYGGTLALNKKVLPRLGIEARMVDGTDMNRIEEAIDKKTKYIFIESPANPTVSIIDIEACVDIAKRHGIKLVVDNTFATPYLQRPLKMGADIVMHSSTKYIGGHGDCVSGVAVGDKEFMTYLKKNSLVDTGGILSPFNAWLLLRGLKTLPVRMDRHCDNAMRVAQFLSFHPKVAWVSYPGLKTHPQHELAARQMSKFGGIIAFEIKGGIDESMRMIDGLKLCTQAVSLGDCDTLITHPASTVSSSYTEEERQEAGIAPGMLRISVGIEDVSDIMEDLNDAFRKI